MERKSGDGGGLCVFGAREPLRLAGRRMYGAEVWIKELSVPARRPPALRRPGPAGMRKRRARSGVHARYLRGDSVMRLRAFPVFERAGYVRSNLCSALRELGCGGRCPEPAQGTSPLRIPFAAALGCELAFLPQDKDLDGSDIWPSRSSFSNMCCQKRRAGFKPPPWRRRIRR